MTTIEADNVDEAAILRMSDMVQRLGVHEQTIRRWVKRGMPASRPGRDLLFSKASLEWCRTTKPTKVQP
jgi:excisionase family DNA binding protein